MSTVVNRMSPPSVPFSGAGTSAVHAVAKGLTSQAVIAEARKSLNPLAKLGLGFLKMKERPGGNVLFQFIQDTAILWAPKFLVSRSWLEKFEITFLEFVESGLFYFYPPLVGAAMAKYAFRHVAPQKPAMDLITTAVSKLKPNDIKKVVPVKLGLFTAAVGTAITIEYGLNFVKNMITEKGFKQVDFSSIIGFTQNKVDTKQNQETHVFKKAKRRIAECAAIGLASVAVGLGMARWGHLWMFKPNAFKYVKLGFKGLSNTAQFLKLNRLARFWEKKHQNASWASLTEWLDFDYKLSKSGKHWFDLGGNQLKIFMPFAIAGYWDSARDPLEFVEVAIRSTITGGYIGFGANWLKAGFRKFLGPKYQNTVLYSDANDFSSVKKLVDMGQHSIDKATTHFANRPVTKAQLLSQATKEFLPAFEGKNRLANIPFVFGILVIGLFTTLMNQQWTKKRFTDAQQKQQHQVVQSKKVQPSVPARPQPEKVTLPIHQSVPAVPVHYTPSFNPYTLQAAYSPSGRNTALPMLPYAMFYQAQPGVWPPVPAQSAFVS